MFLVPSHPVYILILVNIPVDPKNKINLAWKNLRSETGLKDGEDKQQAFI